MVLFFVVLSLLQIGTSLYHDPHRGIASICWNFNQPHTLTTPTLGWAGKATAKCLSTKCLVKEGFMEKSITSSRQLTASHVKNTQNLFCPVPIYSIRQYSKKKNCMQSIHLYAVTGYRYVGILFMLIATYISFQSPRSQEKVQTLTKIQGLIKS